MSSRLLKRANTREPLAIYILASLSSVFLSASQYLAVSAAAASGLPIDSETMSLVATFGRGPGILLVLLSNSLVFQGILGVLVLALALSSTIETSRRWAFASSGLAISGFVGYWLGAKFLTILEWISTLQNNRVDSSNTYTSLFWFGLAATICYLAMILVLRRSYGKISNRYSLVQ